MNARQNTHDNNFALLHILGAMFVICGHSYALLGKAAPMLMGVSVHTFGVEILFAISGFLVTQSYMRKRQLLIFYRNRIARILPPLAVCLILTLFFGAFISFESTKLYLQGAWTYFWHNILMYPYFYVPGLFTDLAVPNALNGSLWTLPIELSCYLLLPLVVLCCGRSGRRQSCIPPAVIFLLLVIGDSFIQIQGTDAPRLIIWGTDWAQAIRLVAFFSSGVLTACAINIFPAVKRAFRPELALLAFLMTEQWGIYFPQLRYLLLPYVIFSLAFAPPIKSKFFNSHDYAYGLYLYAFPVQQTLVWELSYRRGIPCEPLVLLFASTAITLVPAALSYYLIEKPTTRLLARIDIKNSWD